MDVQFQMNVHWSRFGLFIWVFITLTQMGGWWGSLGAIGPLIGYWLFLATNYQHYIGFENPLSGRSLLRGTHLQLWCEHGICGWCRTSKAPDWRSYPSIDTASRSLLLWKRWEARGQPHRRACLLPPKYTASCWSLLNIQQLFREEGTGWRIMWTSYLVIHSLMPWMDASAFAESRYPHKLSFLTVVLEALLFLFDCVYQANWLPMAFKVLSAESASGTSAKMSIIIYFCSR